MGLFSSLFGGGGGGSSSSSTTSTTTTSNTNAPVTLASDGDSRTVYSDGGTVNMLDEGAIEKALLLAQLNYESTVDSFKSLITLADDMFIGAKESVDMASLSVNDAYKAANQVGTPLDINKAVFVFGGVAGLYFLMRGKS